MKLFLLPYLEQPLHSIAEAKVLADNVLTNPGHQIFIQDWMGGLQFTPIVLWRMGKVGKCIDPQYMNRYLQCATIGISFKAEGGEEVIPEQMRYGFDSSIVRGNLWWKADENVWDSLSIKVIEKEKFIEDNQANNMIFPDTKSIEESIALISQYFLLKIGDLIAFPLWREYRPIAAEQGIFIANQKEEEILYCGIK